VEYVVLVLALLVVAVLTAVGLVVGPRRRRLGAPPPADAHVRAVDTVELPDEPGLAEPPAGPVAVEEPPPPILDVPEPVAGRLVRLRGRLARSQSVLGRSLLAVLSRGDLDEDAWEEIEDTLLQADVGVAATRQIVENLRTQVLVRGTRSPAELRSLLRAELLAAIGTTDRSLRTLPAENRPAVVLVVGVNGTGKTTTCGKLARVLVADGRSVLLGAADTFRAAAVEQLATWGARVGADVVRGPESGDPASVAFDTVRQGAEQRVDVVLIDTAGRLHTKSGLMDELGKVKRVVEKQSPVDEVLLVLDATTGQNGMVQARVFAEVVDVTGIVLTKLDGTAKGGIVVAVQRELGVPVKLVGLGEGPDDLAPFEPDAFVDALLGDEAPAAA
jgi:fused signal recognition particle receptor